MVTRKTQQLALLPVSLTISLLRYYKLRSYNDDNSKLLTTIIHYNGYNGTAEWFA